MVAVGAAAGSFEIIVGGRKFDLSDAQAQRPWDFIKEWDKKPKWHRLFEIWRDMPAADRSMMGAYTRWLEEAGLPPMRTLRPHVYVKRASAYWEERAAAYEQWVGRQIEAARIDQMIERNNARITSLWDVTEQVRSQIVKYVGYLDRGIKQTDTVVERWEQGEVAVPGTPKTILRVAQLKLRPVELLVTLQKINELQREALGLPSGQSTIIDNRTAVQVNVNAQAEEPTWEEHIYALSQQRVVHERDWLRERVAELERALSASGIPIPAPALPPPE